MLSTRYLSNFIYRGLADENIPDPSFGKGLQTRREMLVLLICYILSKKIDDFLEGNRTFSIVKSSTGEISRRGHLKPIFMNLARLNEGDVYHVSKTKLDSIPLGSPIPTALNYRGCVINTTAGQLYLVLDEDLRSLPSGLEVLDVFNMHYSNITSDVDENLITILIKKLPIPNKFHEIALVRAHKSKEI